MRTNIDIDDSLLEEAQVLSKLNTKKKVVEEAIKTYIAQLKRERMIGLFGNTVWEGDLHEMRSNK